MFYSFINNLQKTNTTFCFRKSYGVGIEFVPNRKMLFNRNISVRYLY